MAPDSTPSEDGEQHVRPRVTTSRRRFLEATGIAGLVGGVGGFAMAQQDSPTTYRFGGEVSGWQGRAPPAIEGETNPTIQLEAGTEYEVIWENLDGVPHDFTIQDSNGNNLASTETMSEQGATRSLTFTASEDMAQYICTIHPTSMVGDIEITGGGGAGQQTPQQQRAGFVPQGPAVGVQRVADGPLTNPVSLRPVPGMENTHLVADQAGQIYVHQDGELQSEPILDISDRLAIGTEAEGGFDRPEGFDERGLLGLAFHPNFQENGQFYVRYSADEAASDGELVGPSDREIPENWDHIEVLAEFQMAGQMAATPTEDGGTNATQGNQTQDETATQVGGGPLQADPNSARILLEIPSPQFNHNGGDVAFGPDGYIYASIGDGGDANDTGVGHREDWYDQNEGGNAQNVTDNLLGSVLRVDVDQKGDGKPYAVPDDNPLVGTDGMDEIYAWGLRNPWRMSFNDGMLVAGDVGQNLFEEIDVIENGGNYGWNVREGFHCFDAANATQVPDQCPTTAPEQAPFGGQDLLDPVLEYPHTYQGNSVGISITGGYVYQGQQLSNLAGRYVFGDWSSSFTKPQGRIFVARSQGQGGGETPTAETEAGNATNATETDQIGNVSVAQEQGAGNETNATGGNETGGNATGTDTAAPLTEQVKLMQPSQQPWPYQELKIQGGENQQLNRFISAFGRDANGNVYVLASRTGRITGQPGEILQIVSPGQGEEISQPEIETPTPEDGAAGNETSGNETGD